MDQKIMPVIRLICHLILAKWNISHHYIKKIIGMVGFLKSSDLDICFWVKLFRYPSCQAVKLHSIQAALLHRFRQHSKEISRPHRRLQDISFFKPHPAKCFINGTDDYRGSIMGIQGGLSGGNIFFRA